MNAHVPEVEVPADPQELAQAVGTVMYAGDAASQGLDMKVEEMAPGYARLTMRVRPDMLNGHKTCHGGFIFALADSAFAFSCNSRNVSTVASGCTIDYLAPGFEGDLLTAVAQERSLAGRTGVYDVTVTNQDGRNVALFRGRSYRIKARSSAFPRTLEAASQPKLYGRGPGSERAGHMPAAIRPRAERISGER